MFEETSQLISEPEEHKEPEDDEEDLEDLDEDPEEVEAKLALATDDDEETDESSLDELLSQRAAARRGSDEQDDDDDIMALASEKEPKIAEVIPPRVIPIKDREEFVCNRCHLVKARSQLADDKRGLCRDCV
ncbi:MAG: DUF4193 family protein [Actinomycetota bacterium]|nr:DUF4193 family protein [Actinomycetota bacterium]